MTGLFPGTWKMVSGLTANVCGIICCENLYTQTQGTDRMKILEGTGILYSAEITGNSVNPFLSYHGFNYLSLRVPEPFRLPLCFLFQRLTFNACPCHLSPS
jgi:hypothetical protein